MLRFTCAECQQFVYDLKTGERSKTCNGLVDVARIKGPDGRPATPCRESPNKCPKESPERERDYILTEANRKTYQLYLETQATAGAGFTEAMKADRWLRRMFAVIHGVVEAAKANRQTRDLVQVFAGIFGGAGKTR